MFALKLPSSLPEAQTPNMEYLSRGHYGTVYKLVPEPTDTLRKPEVVKINHVGGTTGNEVMILKRLVDERQRLKEMTTIEGRFDGLSLLGSGNVVKFLGEDGRAIKMRYVDGKPITEISLDDEKYCSIFLQTLCALKFIHSAGVSHHDVHEGNVMYDTNGKVKLIDFGISSSQSDVDESRRLSYIDIQRDILGFKFSMGKRFLDRNGFLEFGDELPHFSKFAKKVLCGRYGNIDEIFADLNDDAKAKRELEHYAIWKNNRFIRDFIYNLEGRQLGRTKKDSGTRHL